MVDNSLFFASYNHLHHFHKAHLLHYSYHNQEKYFHENLGSKYSEEDLRAYYFPGDEGYFHRTMALDMRSTYFHCIETLFSLVHALRAHATSLIENPNSVNILEALTVYDQKRLYADIERHAMDPRSLDFLFERIDGSEWTYGRFIFYAAVNPPDNVLADLLPRMEDSLRAMQYGMHVMAKDLDDRKEYNNYKHALRVVDSFKKLFLWDRIKSQLLEVDTGVSYSYPKFDRKNRVYNITSVPLDFERDYNMCVLASVFVQMIVTNRRVAHNKLLVKVDGVPQAGFSMEDIQRHAMNRVTTKTEVISFEEMEKRTGIKIVPPIPNSNDPDLGQL